MKKILLVGSTLLIAAALWQGANVDTDDGFISSKTNEDASNVKPLPWLMEKKAISVGGDVEPALNVINIGEATDPETYLGKGAEKLINIGEDIDPETDPNLYVVSSELINIGDFIDPEGDPNFGRAPSELINLGDDIDADEYFFGAAKGAEELINIGESVEPDDESL